MRYKMIKEKAIKYKGGKCCLCGYNKYNGALEFHHINPDEKDFNISKDGHVRSWERVRGEIDKCVLLCANCHRELHNLIRNDLVSKEIVNKLDNNYGCIILEKIEYKETTRCVDCNCEITNGSLRCMSCSKISQRKVDRPPYKQLIKEIEKLGYTGTGRKYGVSDNAIRNWKNKYEIND